MIDLRLYLVTDEGLAAGRSLADIVRRAVAGGVTCVQLRAKTASSRVLLQQAMELIDVIRPLGVPLIVNDRLDIALAAGAAGVHVGQEDLPCDVVRRLVPPGFCIGVSVSTLAEVRAAEAAGADYLGVSPVFDTPTKRDTPVATGLEGLRRIRAATRLPLVAIGGIHVDNAAAVRGAGADGLAVVSAIIAADDPTEAARQLAGV